MVLALSEGFAAGPGCAPCQRAIGRAPCSKVCRSVTGSSRVSSGIFEMGSDRCTRKQLGAWHPFLSSSQRLWKGSEAVRYGPNAFYFQ